MLVYRQNGITHDNVFADWRSLMFVANKIAGPYSIAVDASLVGGVATVPAGDWTLQAASLVAADPSSLPILSFDDGAHIVTTDWWRIADGLSVTNTGAAVWTPATNSSLYVDAGFLGTLGSPPIGAARVPRRVERARIRAATPATASPFVTVGPSVQLFALMFNTGVLGDDTTATFNLTDPTAVFSVFGSASGSDDQLGQFSCTGVPGSTVNYSHDSTSLARNIVVAGQVFHEIMLSGAGVTAYTPGSPADWAPPAPTQAAAAIDRLAAAVRGLLGAPIP